MVATEEGHDEILDLLQISVEMHNEGMESH